MTKTYKQFLEELSEKINIAKTKMGDVIKDFQDSDAPQFKGKSDKKRREMAIAAKLEADRGVKEEVEDLEEISQMMARAARDKAGEEIAGHRKAIAKEWDKNKPNYGKISDIQHQLERRKRLSDKVTRKLAKEDVEQTDEELKGKQHKIDANKNGKIDGHDFKILRNAKKARYQ